MMTPDSGNASDNPQQDKSQSEVPSVQLGPVETSLLGAPKVSANAVSGRVDYGALQVSVEDLSEDRLLLVAPKSKYNEAMVPTLGGIPLLGKIGQGGMGAVYRGIHLRLNKQVAVKVLPLHLVEQQPNLVQRFIREAQIAAQVMSPHLVNVNDVNQESGLFYLVMEFVDGVSAGSYLKTRLQNNQGPFDEASALDTCIAATAGLNAAHSEGIIHRDIKPDNILIPRMKSQNPGEPSLPLLYKASKLADLGLARTENVNAELTGTQSTMGTPGYIAPEQALNTKKAGKPADVFSMGATLYGLLAGHAPFVGETPMEALLAAVQKPHTPIQEYRPDVSHATSAVIELCLIKTPNNRYPDAATLLKALQEARNSVKDRPSRPEMKTVMMQRPSPAGGKSDPLVTVALDVEKDSEFLIKLQEGENLLLAQLYPEAIAVFNEAKTTYPQARQLHRAEAGLRAAEQAIADIQYAELCSKANDKLKAKDFEAAEKAFITAISKRPGDADAQRGLKDARAGKLDAQYQAALIELQTLLKAEVRDAHCWYVRTSKRGKIDEAITQALRIKPTDQIVRAIRDQIGPPPDIRVDLGSGVKLDLVLVQAGEFMMGSDEEKPVHRVKITESFYISKFMTTVGQFRRFVEATNYRSDAEKDVLSTGTSISRKLSWKSPGFEQKEDHPVVVVTWNDAQAFAAWITEMTSFAARLPTEAEWEYAARGPKSNVYPFGNNWDGKEINHADTSLRRVNKSSADIVYSRDNDGFPYTSPVGALQNTCWCGAYDMSGNAWEWCQDYYDGAYYKVSPDTDPKGPTSGIYRILRGGAWNVTPENCKLWVRLGSTPAYRDSSYGFRIVVNVNQA